MFGFFDERKNYNFKSKYLNSRLFFIFNFFRLTEKPCNNSSCYTYPTLPIREFHDLNRPVASAMDDREYAVPDVNFYSTFSPKHNFYSPRLIRTPISHCCMHLTMCQQSSIEGISSIEATCGNNLMIKTNLSEENQQILIKEMNSDDLIFIEKLGEGLFGSIHLAEINKQNVIVKSLNDNTNDKQKYVINILKSNYCFYFLENYFGKKLNYIQH